jgi:two-component system, cell cycle sensor histidine kinase and response regulator CckA
MNGVVPPSAAADAVSSLTGRMAHEFSNVLTIVLAKADLLADGLPPDDTTLLPDLEDLRRAARRGADLTDRMLSYARRQPLDLHDLDLVEVLATMKSTLACLLPTGVTLVMSGSTDPGRFRVRADQAALQRILVNLVANARDAMPSGGTVAIALERARASDGAGETVSVVVYDTGEGIAPDLRDRVFEPFFTTRDPKRGTGLGLSVVQSLVQQQGGTVSLDAATERGTVVRLTFPALPVTDGSVRTGTPAPEGGLILIAEDEEMIRRAAKRVLERYGYTVLQAADGAEAMERIVAAGHALDLVISDLVMPHVGGLELHREARAGGYEMPFLFMSGYQRDDVERTVAEDPTLDFLPKPWSVPELVARVRAIVGAAVCAVEQEVVL